MTKQKKSVNVITDSSYIVGIGSSAGGLEALQSFIKGLPKKVLDATYIVAQHLSPQHKSMLVELLGKTDNIEVLVAEDGISPEVGKMYITPPNSDIEVIDRKIRLSKPDEPIGPKPSADKLFKSIANEFHINAIGVILSGTGSDGALGIQAIRTEGGITIAQEQDTAKYDGMPQSAIDTDCVDAILAPQEIGDYLDKVVKTGKQRPVIEQIAKSDLEQILNEVKASTNISFHGYKENTLRRRLERRMVANGISSLSDYLKLIQKSSNEPQLLAQDFLISVTEFFRDKSAFENLAKLIKSKLDPNAAIQNLRIWSVGCATGEEAYSIAILCAEMLGGPENLSRHRIQIFATDIDSNALAVAREGSYNFQALENIPIDIRKRYFLAGEDKLTVVKQVKDCILFSKHNILENPPFSRIDVVVCRNVLIYFSTYIQEKVFKIFHYSLLKNGHMFLGKSESVGNAEHYFKKMASRGNFYTKRSDVLGDSTQLKFQKGDILASTLPKKSSGSITSSKSKLLESFIQALAPNSVLVDQHLDILHVYGDVTPFVKLVSGKPSMNLATNVVQSFRQEVRVFAFKVVREGVKAKTSRRPVDINGTVKEAWITFYPLINEYDDNHMLACFETATIEEELDTNELSSDQASNANVAMLEQELQATQEHLQTVIEELETLNEELQSTNEELQSSNEELHSTNEELETSNEELQSTNEELTTVNDELGQKKVELEKGHYELLNVQNSIMFPVIRLNDNLQIVNSNNAAQELFKLNGKKKLPLVRSLPDTLDVMAIVKSANDILQDKNAENFSVEYKGRHFWLQFHPFRTGSDETTGVILTMVDETEQVTANTKLFDSQARFNALASSAVIPIYIKDLEGRYVSVNEGFEHLLEVSEKDIIGRTDAEIIPDQPHQQYRDNDLDVQRKKKPLAYEESFQLEGETVTYLSIKAPLFDKDGEVYGISGISLDISKQKRYAAELERTNKEVTKANQVKSDFLANMSHEIRTPLNAICGIADMLENFKITETKRQEMTHKLGLAAQQLFGLINDILDFSSLEGAEFKLNNEPFSLKGLCEDLNDINSVKANQKQLSLTFDIDSDMQDYYIGDVLRLKQVLLNIIDNGIKFTDKGGVSIKVSSDKTHREKKDIVQFKIVDTGAGIEKKYLEEIFVKFAQGSSQMSKKSKGTGLGLSISKALVEKMLGKILVNSKVGEGTTFIVRLPLGISSKQEYEDANKADNINVDDLSQKLPVLVVEDTETNIDVMCSYLDHVGLKWEVARNGKTALEMVESQQYSLILLDLQMDDMDGFQVTKAIRSSKNKLAKQTPIVAVTGHAEKSIKEKCFELGMQDFLVKPLRLKNLSKVLQSDYTVESNSST